MQHERMPSHPDFTIASTTDMIQMLFTWDTENLCIVFRQWRVTSTPSLLFSLIVVILLGVGYEGLRSICRSYELSLDKNVKALPRKYFSRLQH